MTEVYIKESCFLDLKQIAEEEREEHKESAAVLYGFGDTIAKCEKYISEKASAGNVEWNNQDDLVKVLNEASLRGVFHSHLFASANPSTTDMKVMQGLSRWCKMMERRPLYFVIGAFFPEFGIVVWEMDENYNLTHKKVLMA